MKVWLEVVDYDGKPYANMTTTNIEVDKKESLNVHEFRKVVCNQLGTMLSGILPRQLLVYSNKDAFDEKESPLENDESINGHGSTKSDAVIVLIQSLTENTKSIQQEFYDKAKWLSEFRNSQVASHDLPLLGALAGFIASELPVKIGINQNTLEKWMIVMGIVPEDLVAKLFYPSNSEPCADFLIQVVNRIVQPVTTGASEASFIAFWDDMICHVLKYVLYDTGKMERNSSHSASTGIKRPDFLFFVNSVCVFRGKEKAPGSDTATPRSELIEKMKWRYGDVPYLLGYTAVGFEVRLYAIIHTGGDNIDAKELGVFNLTVLSGRFRLLLAVLHISRLLQSIESLCDASRHVGDVLVRSNGVHIHFNKTSVKKHFPETSFQEAKLHAVSVYNILKENAIPNVDRLCCVCPNLNTLEFEPLGDDVKPSTLAELFRALKDVFQALIKLHEKSWMHRDIRWSNVMKSRDGSGSWFLIDFMDAAESPQHSPSGRLLSQSEHAPEIFESSSHTVAVDIWSMGHLIVTCGKELTWKWFDLGKERSKFLERLLEKDPLKRPSALEALETLKQVEKQYEAQVSQYEDEKSKFAKYY
jgi:Protein kinase domain